LAKQDTLNFLSQGQIRGVEITKEALEAIVTDKESKAIDIYWQRTKIDYSPYQRWVDTGGRNDAEKRD
jgi:hypothetical protein